MDVFYCEGKIGIYGYNHHMEIVIGDVDDEMEQNPYALSLELLDMETSKLVKELNLINPLIKKNLQQEGINDKEFYKILEKAKQERKSLRDDQPYIL
jgi:hypothetical protein